jgi:hypothetical protein
MKAVTSHEGVMLEIEYEKEDQHVFKSARVLDENYRATGPNLLDLLDKCFLLTGPAEGTKFFDLVSEELADPGQTCPPGLLN